MSAVHVLWLTSVFFFFSSRRRHTRFDCDWSSDVCSSDLFPWLGLGTSLADAPVLVQWADIAGARGVTLWLAWCNVVIVEAAVGEGGEGRRPIGWRPLGAGVATVALAFGYGAGGMQTPPGSPFGGLAC